MSRVNLFFTQDISCWDHLLNRFSDFLKNPFHYLLIARKVLSRVMKFTGDKLCEDAPPAVARMSAGTNVPQAVQYAI